MKIATIGMTLFGGIAALLILLAVGCGGGGGGGSVSNPITITLTSSAQQNTLAFGQSCTITANVSNTSDTTVVFTISPAFAGFTQNGHDTANFTAPSTPGSYIITAKSDANSAVIQTITIKVVAVTVVISPKTATVGPNGVVQFTGTVSGSTNTAVTFSSPSGTFQAVTGNPAATNYTAPSAPGQYAVTATAAASSSATSTATVTVSAGGGANATVSGTVTDSNSNDVPGVVVQFFNATGTELGQATTSSSGAFSASVPTMAVSFTLSSASINTATYYESFTFGKLIYDPLVAGCNAPLPTLISGGTSTLGAIVIAANGGPPPPPPTGCG